MGRAVLHGGEPKQAANVLRPPETGAHVVGGIDIGVTLAGTPEAIDCGANLDGFDFSTQAFTVCAFARVPPGGASQSLVGNEIHSGTFAGWDLFVRNTGLIQFQLIQQNAAPSKKIQVRSTAEWDDSLWHHICVTYDGTNAAAGAAIYVDGAIQAVTVPADDAMDGPATSGVNLTVGARQTAQYLAGDISDVRVYGRELSAEEVDTIEHLAGRDRIVDGLLFHLPLNEAPPGTAVPTGADALRDKGPDGFHGTVAGGTPDYVQR